MDQVEALPSSVTCCVVGGKEVFLVGTAHVSKQSVLDVRAAIEAIKPDAVCIELCAKRKEAMMDPDRWKKMDLLKVVRQGRALFLLGQLLLGSFYQQIGEKLGVEPGAEMKEAMVVAEETGAELVLADRSVEVTLKRVWRGLSFWNKLRMMYHMLLGVTGAADEVEEADIEKMLEQGQLQDVMQHFAQQFPQVKERLIDERDTYLAQKIRHAPGNKVVAVVGAGHVAGICKEIQKDKDLAPLDQIPAASVWGKVIKWAIPLLIVGLPVMSFWSGGQAKPVESLMVWVVSHTVLASIGAACAFAHPLAILGAGIAAPITSLNPMLAAGWIAGMVQIWIKRPTVGDLEALPTALASARGFWGNPATRVLLVVALANMGSSLGTLLSGAWIFSHLI